MKNSYVIILAAGKGTRMKSKLYKVLHEVSGKSMVDHVISQAEQIHPDKIVTIVGHGAEAVKEKLAGRSEFALQAEQKGTGHAVMQASDLLENLDGTTLVVSGDTPLLTAATFEKLIAAHNESGAQVTVLSAAAPDPFGYGRIVRDEDQNVLKIVEQKDASPVEQTITEINSGVYVFDNKALFNALKQTNNDNAQGEYYLTDALEIIRRNGGKVKAYEIDDFDEIMGVNDRVALAEANKLMQRRINHQLLLDGVTLIDPDTTYVDADVKIGSDTILEGGVVIKGNSQIGEDCYITNGSRIIDSKIENNVTVTSSTIEESTMEKGSNIGPNSHLRPQSQIGRGVHIGNFVEVKKAEIGENSKVGHLTYVGDATIGSDVNVGCGVVFVNYDGVQKFHSTVGNKVFIGSNSNIVNPVNLADNSFVAAGSTITKDVPTHAMGIARARQENKLDFWDRLPLSKDKNWN